MPQQRKLPILAITLGDPNGVGPEICTLATKSRKLRQICRPLVVGDIEILEKACLLFGLKSPFVSVNSEIELANFSFEKSIPVISGGTRYDVRIQPGKVSKKAGAASIAWVTCAVELAAAGVVQGMVTAPLCKESVEKSVPGFQGHTEYIGEMRGDPEPVLCLVHGSWTAAHVSTHCSLKDAVSRVQKPRVRKTALLLEDMLRRLHGLKKPRIGLAALNPHAGENGLFGEEEKILFPLARALRKSKMDISDPLPADVVFPQMKAGLFDGVVAMYHDQGHVVTKTIAFELGKKRKLRGVNATLGLDIVRTSVDHGTGFDIAWKGLADAGSLLDAVEVAAKICPSRQ